MAGAEPHRYQVIGQGPPDLVVTNGSMTHVDIMWDDPAIALMFRRFASFSRLIRFDRLGRRWRRSPKAACPAPATSGPPEALPLAREFLLITPELRAGLLSCCLVERCLA